MLARVIDMPKRATRTSFKRRAMIAKTIKKLRLDAELSIESAARTCGVSIWCWQRWERAQSSVPTERIADIEKALSRAERSFTEIIAPYLQAA